MVNVGKYIITWIVWVLNEAYAVELQVVVWFVLNKFARDCLKNSIVPKNKCLLRNFPEATCKQVGHGQNQQTSIIFCKDKLRLGCVSLG